MTIESIIDNLSREEQILAMELLWKRLASGDAPIQPPDWHREVVAERVARLESGEVGLVSWEDAKKRLMERLP
jgi:hypothetical protein